MLKTEMLTSLPLFELPNIIIINWARKKWHSDKESDTEEANKKSVEDILFSVYDVNWEMWN